MANSKGAWLAVGLMIAAAACGSDNSLFAPAGETSGCPALSACCQSKSMPSSLKPGCQSVVDQKNADSCNSALSQYKSANLCTGTNAGGGAGAGGATGGAGGGTGNACANLAGCCESPSFPSASKAGCLQIAQSNNEPSCKSNYDLYVSNGLCGGTGHGGSANGGAGGSWGGAGGGGGAWGGAGGAGTGGSSCVPNNYVCSDNSNCCSQICNGGVCVSCRPVYSACGSPSECCSGLTCSGGSCVQACGSTGANCLSTSTCCSPLQCMSNGTCNTCKAKGYSCYNAQDCCNGQPCTGGICGSGTGGAGGSGGSGGTGGSGGSTNCGFTSQTPACETCLQSYCCAKGYACSINNDCIDLFNCIVGCSAGDTVCTDGCGNSYPNGISLFNDFINCIDTSCGTQCQ
ncbi:MAG: hypothetical protein HY898_22465 [Deltaproteobacteria bacterium]|nr:hypothetical protein [Deltaproteobacteria bacterium]